ncbi:MAG TPA: L,D-transpeptidase [Desulfurivibrio alkaliphilus]|uniref:L,D-transpeptidase n=1 Tax=Desulfurivibrio alkaliphilus TaxID=427923 RepID=A0A7C2TJK9_9BACT|nr:L,D-transpeptidase [Desulfurivibrio alkaliphilus]
MANRRINRNLLPTIALLPWLLLTAPPTPLAATPGDPLPAAGQTEEQVLFSHATTQSYDRQSWSVIGSQREHRVKGRESLLEIARDYGLGYREIAMANPKLDPLLPGDGAKVVIPAARVLPEAPFEHGILINLAEKRLYYFFQEQAENLVITFPVGIGATDGETPPGDFTITTKLTEPNWTVPESIWQKRPYPQRVIPPGPDNPMGSHALQLSQSSYFIHGTNRPWSIGRRATHGCIRLYPEDIPLLFRLTPPQTPVRIVRQSLKVGVRMAEVYVEVHPDNSMSNSDYLLVAQELLQQKDLVERVDLGLLLKAVREKKGVPVRIDREQGELRAGGDDRAPVGNKM